MKIQTKQRLEIYKRVQKAPEPEFRKMRGLADKIKHKLPISAKSLEPVAGSTGEGAGKEARERRDLTIWRRKSSKKTSKSPRRRLTQSRTSKARTQQKYIKPIAQPSECGQQRTLNSVHEYTAARLHSN